MKARALVRMVLLVIAVARTSCDPGGIPSGVSSNGSSPYGVFTGHLEFSGEFAVKGTFEDVLTSRHETCADYARGLVPATTLLVVPTPSVGTSIGGHTLNYTAGVPINKPPVGYHGPATYTGAGALVADLSIDFASFLPGDSASTTITVRANSSGSLSFTGMQDIDTRASESGHVTWTCVG
jgi:hypothetical protein